MIRELFVRANVRTWMHHYSAHGSLIVPLVLFLLFVIVNAAYLHRVPGLLGDEGSEGVNVFELLTSDRITIVGERSYIGPLIDYVRVPFVGLFGYSLLALRVPVFLLSLVTFWLAWFSFRTLFGPRAGLFALAGALFSPAFLTYQRLGWAITLVPFFVFLTLFFIVKGTEPAAQLTRSSSTRKDAAHGIRKHAPLLAGLALGTGLSTHMLFLASLPSLLLAWVALHLAPVRTNFRASLAAETSAGVGVSGRQRAKALSRTIRDALTRAIAWWPAVIGFWAGFGTQFVVLRTFTEDQGNPREVASLFWPHLKDLRLVLLDVLSGSSYVASYTGREFSPRVMVVTVGLLVTLVLLALLLPARKGVAWVWFLGLVLHLLTLTMLMEHFSPRYFVVFVLGVWALAGIGASVLASRLATMTPRLQPVLPVVIAVLLTASTTGTTLIPFLRTGGSTAEFSLGKRTNTAAAFVDTRPLVSCLREIGPVTSENIHIRNRLQYLELSTRDLDLADDTSRARFSISYRSKKTPGRPEEQCPALAHFIVVPARSGAPRDPQELTQ